MYQNLNGKLTSTDVFFSKDIMKLVRFHAIVQLREYSEVSIKRPVLLNDLV